MTTKLFKSGLVLCLLASMVSCFKQPKQPKLVHPNAGFLVKGFLTCGGSFYRKLPNGKLVYNSQEIRSIGGGHEFKMLWSVDPQASSDLYHLKITVDGVTSDHDVTYSGETVVVMEKPLRIIIRPTWGP